MKLLRGASTSETDEAHSIDISSQEPRTSTSYTRRKLDPFLIYFKVGMEHIGNFVKIFLLYIQPFKKC